MCCPCYVLCGALDCVPLLVASDSLVIMVLGVISSCVGMITNRVRRNQEWNAFKSTTENISRAHEYLACVKIHGVGRSSKL